MIELTSHQVTETDKSIKVFVMDEPHEKTMAHHSYRIEVGDPTSITDINFQKGPVKETTLNGLTGESLLAIVKHRLECFQSSEFRCRENAIALTRIDEALLWLDKRTRDREKRGVEGTHKK